MVKNLPAMQETWFQSLGWEDPLEKGKATHTSYSGLENSMDYAVQNTGVVSHCLLQFPTQGANPADSLQADSLPAEPQGKPKNTAMGSLTLLPTDLPYPEIELGSLHCRQICYQLSYQGSP